MSKKVDFVVEEIEKTRKNLAMYQRSVQELREELTIRLKILNALDPQKCREETEKSREVLQSSSPTDHKD